MSDVLVITVPIVGRYASVNALGRDGLAYGRKSAAYRILFEATQTAAEAAIAASGWATATYFVDTQLVLYRSRYRRQDAGNAGKCEFDALTAAKVWTDDSLALPVSLDLELDPSGPDRAVIVLRRRFPPFVGATATHPIVREARARRAAAPKPSAPAVAVPPARRKEPILVNGVPHDYDETMKEIRTKLHGRSA